MTRGGRLIAVLGGAVLLLAVWVSSTDTIRLLRGAPDAGQDTLFENPPPAHHGRGAVNRPYPEPAGTPLYVVVLEWVVLGLTSLALVTFLIVVLVGRHRRAKAARQVAATWDLVDPADIPDVPPAVVEATRRQLFALRAGAPRNAIVACWMELEQTFQENGFPRDPSETSTEFVTRVLSQFAVGEEAVSSLAALYREARFSEHRLGESHREAAIAALERVAADLHRRPARHVEAVTAP